MKPQVGRRSGGVVKPQAGRRSGGVVKPQIVESTPTADDDDPPPKKPPKFCPWCGCAVLKRWTPNRLRSLYQRPSIKVSYVCLACKVAVRAFKFPSQPLCETKKAARTEAQRDYDELEASGFWSKSARELYQRGKCTCSYPIAYPRVSMPCPIHAPLRRSRSGSSSPQG